MMRFAVKQYVEKTEENVQKLSEQNSALALRTSKSSDSPAKSCRKLRRDTRSAGQCPDARDQETKGHSSACRTT